MSINVMPETMEITRVKKGCSGPLLTCDLMLADGDPCPHFRACFSHQ